MRLTSRRRLRARTVPCGRRSCARATGSRSPCGRAPLRLLFLRSAHRFPVDAAFRELVELFVGLLLFLQRLLKKLHALILSDELRPSDGGAVVGDLIVLE